MCLHVSLYLISFIRTGEVHGVCRECHGDTGGGPGKKLVHRQRMTDTEEGDGERNSEGNGEESGREDSYVLRRFYLLVNCCVYCCIVYCCIVQTLIYLVGDGEGAGVGAGGGKHLFVRVVAAEFDSRVGNDPQHVHSIAAPESENALVLQRG